MARPRNPTPKERLTLWLPLEIRSKLDLLLASELEGRIPQGKYTEFFAELLRSHFEDRMLDLSPLGFPSGFFVRGPKEMVDVLERKLKGT